MRIPLFELSGIVLVGLALVPGRLEESDSILVHSNGQSWIADITDLLRFRN